MKGTYMLALKYKWLSGLFIIFAVVYVAQSLLIAPDQAVLTKYHISSAQATILTLTVAIPYLVIWFIALGGYLRFQDYVRTIQDSKDGAAFRIISQGIMLLTIWLPFSAILGNLLTRYYHWHPEATANMIRLNNYANLLILFVAFWLVNRGTQQLLKLVKQHSNSIPQLASILFIVVSALYVLLTLQDPARHTATQTVTVGSYYLPDWMIITTIVIPRLIMWFLGIQAVYFMYLYRKKVKGTLYKQALRNLAFGLGWVITTTIILRLFQSVSTQLSALSLTVILLVLYALLAVIACGYVLIAKGARSLQRIEEL